MGLLDEPPAQAVAASEQVTALAAPADEEMAEDDPLECKPEVYKEQPAGEATQRVEDQTNSS